MLSAAMCSWCAVMAIHVADRLAMVKLARDPQSGGVGLGLVANLLVRQLENVHESLVQLGRGDGSLAASDREHEHGQGVVLAQLGVGELDPAGDELVVVLERGAVTEALARRVAFRVLEEPAQHEPSEDLGGVSHSAVAYAFSPFLVRSGASPEQPPRLVETLVHRPELGIAKRFLRDTAPVKHDDFGIL